MPCVKSRRRPRSRLNPGLLVAGCALLASFDVLGGGPSRCSAFRHAASGRAGGLARAGGASGSWSWSWSGRDRAPLVADRFHPRNHAERWVRGSARWAQSADFGSDLGYCRREILELAGNDIDTDTDTDSDSDSDVVGSIADRRRFMGSVLLAAGTAMGAEKWHGVPATLASEGATTDVESLVLSSSELISDALQWTASPINKRSGVTLYDAEKNGFNVKFVTYLSRFLLVFDRDCQKWWYTRAKEIPKTSTADQVDDIRLQQFAAFSASVEVGLLEYGRPSGPKDLMNSLVTRYCPTMELLKASREANGEPPLNPAGEARTQREIKEARRQIALLFGLMTQNQPVEEITALLAAVDNAAVTKVVVTDPGAGYAPGYGSPVVTFPPPEAGEGFETVQGRAILRPSGSLLRIDRINRGKGYTSAPKITISAPSNAIVGASTATAKALIYQGGPNMGMLDRIQLLNPGKGYTPSEDITITIEPPESTKGAIRATAEAILELEVGSIEIISGGSGYAAEKPLLVQVEPPPLTARVNMNDPMVTGLISPDDPLPATTSPSFNPKKKLNGDSMSRLAKAQKASQKESGCIGRACYDRPVVAYAYPKSDKDSYTTFRDDSDSVDDRSVERAAPIGARKLSNLSSTTTSPSTTKVSATGEQSALPSIQGRSSSQLLNLLPAGVGLVYDSTLKRYILARGKDSEGERYSQESPKPLDPEFGPRGRSPVERERKLTADTILRFAASGAICCSGAHLLLTPIDVVKTKVQTDPERYPGILSSFKTVLDEEGPGTFFVGWAPTFLGFFVNGAVAYSIIEYFRRTFYVLAGDSAATLEIPIILGSAAIAAVVGSFALAPFEAVRIRSVAQPDYADSPVGVVSRMVNDEGAASLFSAVPAFIPKEILFVCTKFLIFDLFTAYLYDTYPAANEDLKLSLLVSLAGGSLGGMGAAIMSNPMDATISEMKKSQSQISAIDAFSSLLERGSLFRGLQLRIVFYALIVSIQFLVYDFVRFTLGVGSDDLKLYLDVLGGALSETGGPT